MSQIAWQTQAPTLALALAYYYPTPLRCLGAD